MNKRENKRSERAWNLGVEFGKNHKLKGVTTEQMWQESIRLGCDYFFDVFKYGAHSVWRKNKEMEGK